MLIVGSADERRKHQAGFRDGFELGCLMLCGHDFDRLDELLASPNAMIANWVRVFERSPMRLPRLVDPTVLSASLEPIAEALQTLVAPDRLGIRPSTLELAPGAASLREVEKAVSFAAANLAVEEFTGFEIGALFFALRDVLSDGLSAEGAGVVQRYLEWLVVLAADSLATGREQAAIERWHNQLDEGTPLIQITSQLPAALFVCQPDQRVVASVFGRLLLTVVRTGAPSAILDLRGLAGRLSAGFAESLETFLGHKRIAGRVEIFACGVHGDDVAIWKEIADRVGSTVHFENYFDTCVQTALGIGGWRLIGPKS